MKFLVPFFHKKVPFLANNECCPKFLEYALPSKQHEKSLLYTETNTVSKKEAVTRYAHRV